ncbi:hypothetical protein ACFUTU_16500 [Arthrobacter sp. NPDC057388]|jgi:hypothetical protein|uniref:hypothetical protein n=1 Tax=Arthrobacter sp. NPDC057388 TaxID=3346116 RepID=UPI003642A5A9
MASDDVNPNGTPAPPAGEKLAGAAAKAGAAAESSGGKPAEAKPVTPVEPEAPVKPVKPVKQQRGGVVPKKAAEDDPRTWGDSESDNDHDAWLKEQKPPHWG